VPYGAADAWPPGRDPLLIAVFMSDSGQSNEALSEAHAGIGALIAAEILGRS